MTTIDEIRARFFAAAGRAVRGDVDGYHAAVMAVMDGAQAALATSEAARERAEKELAESNRGAAWRALVARAEAAEAEVERLRDALEDIAARCHGSTADQAEYIAREALGKDGE